MTQSSSTTRNSSRSNSSRSGGRRRSGGNNRNSGGGRQRSGSTRKPEKKKGFFAKLLSIFGLEGDSNKGTGRPKSVKRVSGADKTASNTSERRSKPSRAPEIVPVESPRLYLGNLSYDATESDLNDLFSGVGTVQEVEIITHRRTQRSKGYAFLEMTSVEEAERAVQNLHDKDFMGRKLVVSGAKDRGSYNDED